MPALPSTEQAIRGLAPEPGKAQAVYRDAKIGGLVLIVGARAKTWAIDYRADGRRRMHSLGKFPAMGLAAARRAAEAQRAGIANGADPQAEREAYRAAETVGVALDRWLTIKIDATRTAAETRRYVEKDIRPVIGAVKLPDFGRRHLTAATDPVLARGSHFSANRVHDILSAFCGWLYARGEIDADPSDRMEPPAEENARERALADAELATLWRSLDDRVSPQAALAIRLLILLGRRLREVTGLRWEELDMEGATWTLPAERNKSGRTWVFPLPEAAMAMLRERWAADGEPVRGYVLRGKRIGGREPAPTGAIVARAKPWLDGLQGPNNRPVLPQDWQIRDLRRTARTGWSRLGVLPHVAEMMLGHTVKGLTAVYDQHRFAQETRTGFELWASHVLQLVGDPAGARVVPLARAG